MLELRPCCECCGTDLPPESAGAFICTFECTFCARCRDAVLGGVCPNCGGNLERRPIRPPGTLRAHPASSVRIVKPDGCAPQAGATGEPAHARGV